MKKILVLIFITLNIITYSNEEIYVAIRSRNLVDSFFPMLMDDEGRAYIAIEEIWMFYDLVNTEIVDNERLVGEIGELEVDSSLVFDDNLVVDDRLYINILNLEKVLPMKSVEFDEEMYSLFLAPDFKLPYEIAAEKLAARRALGFSGDVEEEKDVFRMDRNLFGLGVVDVDYSRSSLSEGDNESVSFGYSSEFLYGDLRLSGSVYDERQLNYVTLDYDSVEALGGKGVSVGDIYLRTYPSIDVDSSLRGVSISGNQFYGRRKQGSTVIEGIANGIETVEIYQNGVLVDYQDVEDNIYKFDIKTSSSDDEFTIIKYYDNGREEEETIYLLSDSQIFPKGSWDYIVQAGRSEDVDKNQYMYNLKYGLTDNLTLGIGNSFFKSEDDDGDEVEYNILEGNLAYRTSAWKYPSMYIMDYLWDLDEEEGTLFLNYTQKIRDYKFEVEYENYSDRFAESEGIDQDFKVVFGRRFWFIDADIEYYNERFEGETYEEVRLDTSFRFTGVRVNIDHVYEMTEDDDQYSVKLGLDYTGELFDWLNINYSTDINVNDGESDTGHSLRLSRRGDTEGRDYLDVGLDFSYDSSDHLVSSLEVDYYFDDFMRMDISFDKSDGTSDDDHNIGIDISKSLALGDLRKQYIKDRESFWIDGVIFKDTNANGEYDVGEYVLEGVGVRSGEIEAYTDEYGRYSLQGIKANSVEQIELIRETLDPTLESQLGDMYVEGRIGRGMIYDIPLLPLSSVGGNLSIRDEESLGVSGRSIYIKTVVDFLQDGEVKHSIVPESDGFFIIDEILPGEYDVEVIYLGRGVTLKEEKRQLSIPSDSDGDYYEVEYKLDVSKEDFDE